MTPLVGLWEEQKSLNASGYEVRFGWIALEDAPGRVASLQEFLRADERPDYGWMILDFAAGETRLAQGRTNNWVSAKRAAEEALWQSLTAEQQAAVTQRVATKEASRGA